ncbi:hypothetical protein [Sphingomonas morindae]|uniref:Uncharacterized protein n=1 Tax=Sphingomonas morindae TaxID=1541170 RepID=A0ABY4X3R1_9SPHN|nr:hypothetical protein [Sphingomonas morindae]USI71490.1 hypothetical protein LHA26_09060 [Sphingomonas morindae]
MSDDKQPMQADGEGTTPRSDQPEGELASRRGAAAAAGESGGGAYPHGESPSKGKGPGRFLGHGGQSGQAYHGSGQLGEEDVGGNANSPSKAP